MKRAALAIPVSALMYLAACAPAENVGDPGVHCSPATTVARDTARYETFSGGGRYALLYCDDSLIDTVDVDFGVHRVGSDSLVYLTIGGSTGDPPDEQWHTIDQHILFDGTLKTVLSERLPYLDDYFSSPSISGDTLYYWGLTPETGRLYAMRYRFAEADLDSVRLGARIAPTDYRFYLEPPVEQKEDVLFRAPDRAWALSTSGFQLRNVE